MNAIKLKVGISGHVSPQHPLARPGEGGDAVVLAVYVIYGPDTSDHPGVYVVRRWTIEDGRMRPDAEPIGLADDLAAARRLVPSGHHRLPHGTGDGSTIVETWF